ncbi:hypothetical protein ACMFMG_003744 [Clarireedia jacksonii]
MGFLNIAAQEAHIAWSFNHRDLTATVVPFSLFTAASSLQAQAPWTALAINTSNSALLGFLLLYTFTISNQLNGIEEDRLNKPDRPIVSGRVTIQGAYTRYQILSVGALIFAYHMQVESGAFMFMVFGALHNFTEFSAFGPMKDFLTTAVLTSRLHSAWQIGGGDARRGLEWIFCLAVNLLFSISMQDLRDVVGDAATGRRTTPLMLGSHMIESTSRYLCSS